MDPLADETIETVRRAVREAGRIQAEGLSRVREVVHKGRYNLVTDVDRQCEELIKDILQKAFGPIAMLAEESDPDDKSDPLVWIIDPLDGTTNYTHGYPAFCSVVALRHRGEIVLGAVYEPIRDELFEARQGQGALLNGKPIRVSRTQELSQSLLATGFPYDRLDQKETNLDRFSAMTLRTQGVRRGGSAALDLCYTACGRLDGFWEIRLCPWDVSAGAFIVKEAGGRVTRLDGSAYDYTGAETLATNGLLHEKLRVSLEDLPPGAPFFG